MLNMAVNNNSYPIYPLSTRTEIGYITKMIPLFFFFLFSIGIHKYSSNLGVLGELGRYPFIIDIIKMLVKYWIKLRTKRSYKSQIHDCFCEAELIDASGGQSRLTWLKESPSYRK